MITSSNSESQHNSNNVTPVRSKPAEAAGKPSNWEDTRRSSYAGRRSRRNSLSDESQVRTDFAVITCESNNISLFLLDIENNKLVLF